MRYYEDFPAGMKVLLGSVTVGEDEITGFARKWDPQSFHTDAEAASASIFGGLVASGIHTLALYMRLFVDGLLVDASSLGSPGIDELRWPKPLRAGDRLTATYSVLSARPSRSRSDWGVVEGMAEGHNQHGDLVLGFKVVNLFGRRGSRQAGP